MVLLSKQFLKKTKYKIHNNVGIIFDQNDIKFSVQYFLILFNLKHAYNFETIFYELSQTTLIKENILLQTKNKYKREKKF